MPLASLINTRSRQHSSSIKPVFFDLSDSLSQSEFIDLLKGDSEIRICNEIDSCLSDLFELREPSVVLNADELAKQIDKHLGLNSIEEYGVWVYYPWSKTMVHLPYEDEFIELRTNRNMYKVTVEERALLSEKKVGVVGLSVGQTVSVTLAMERSVGELRLADFDTLELTNLNRIRTGVQNLGEKKTSVVTQEIAEIDPFIEVKVFPEGITDESLDDFLLKDGKLDLLIDECDDLRLKIRMRQRARELGIPVLMETSDRGMVDVELYNKEPIRELFHGKIADHEIDQLLNSPHKAELFAKIVDISQISERAQLSLNQVGKTIKSWPQLASDVTYGGGICAKIARMILLEEFTQSGRYYFDINGNINQQSKGTKKVSREIKES